MKNARTIVAFGAERAAPTERRTQIEEQYARQARGFRSL